ncbi:uncharacterized protein LOC126769476 [Nymphalis io]|uniref:uncharacterized protein LOC126769476 n=1 Tax=Inachis io TaxID=171585 RepID=UPI002169DCBA|nr:uncharacterized protein LOC126769476 [Nymphalis io]
MQDQDVDGEPAHHARRPMNAFLIFCKRHRSVVRDKYPNLENRSITKILGEWWANLDKEEKACYTGLAKQYKDAFFSANPDFKWYKLPAPPLRTLSSRPRESTEKNIEPLNNEYPENELEKTNNNSTKYDYNKKSNDNGSEIDIKPLSMFTPGKLADEAQMGGLSSLLATKTEVQTPNPYYSPPSYKFNAISSPIEYRSQNTVDRTKSNREDSIRELQNALTETTKMFEDDFEGKEKHRYAAANEPEINQEIIDHMVDKPCFKEEEGCQKSLSEEDEKNSKSDRSCKGKRYQEFMAVGGLLMNKRQRRDGTDGNPDEDYNASCSCDPGSSLEETKVTEDLKNSSLNDTSVDIEIKEEHSDTPDPDNNANKTFKAADFDLDAKIKALPSLSLEKFQQKKRDNKRKKKTINLKPKALESSQIINSVLRPVLEERRDTAENWRETVIGSQKRKPRKISITRLEINSLVSSMGMNGGNKISPEIKIATEAPCTVVHSMEICNQTPSNVDLFALATLAEVAANTSKIEDTEFNAKANGDNASQV